MPEPVRREYSGLKRATKGPLWQFLGLGALAMLIALGSYAAQKDKQLELEYIASPQAGDVYKYKIEGGSYSTLKVIDISEDSVFIAPNEYEINKPSKIYEIDKPDNYSKISYGTTKVRMKEMYDAGEILDINR